MTKHTAIPAGIDLREEIDRLRKERKAVILAHYYQKPELQDLADFVGDSLELSRKAAETDAEVMRQPYLERMRQALAEWKADLLGLGVAYELMPIDQPVDQALRRFLLGRRRLP